jgi:hypothetical protein
LHFRTCIHGEQTDGNEQKRPEIKIEEKPYFIEIKAHAYRSLLDCDKTDAARTLVSCAYFGLARTFAARSSVVEPVCFVMPRCERAEAANVFATLEVLPLRNVSEARLATRPDVCLMFLDMILPFDNE